MTYLLTKKAKGMSERVCNVESENQDLLVLLPHALAQCDPGHVPFLLQIQAQVTLPLLIGHFGLMMSSVVLISKG